MNLYALLIGAVMWLGTLTAAFFYGVNTGDDHATAAVAREDRVARVATAAAVSAAASAIAGIEVKNVTIQRKLEREVLTREVFRDCRSGPDAVQLLNASSAIDPAGAASAAGGQLPASGPAR